MSWPTVRTPQQRAEPGPSISRMLTMSLRRSGAWAIVADGLVWLVYGLITREFAPNYWSATRFIDYVAIGLYSGGLFLLAVALAAIHARQPRRGGLFERAAFLVAIVGASLAGVGDFVEDGFRVAAAAWVFFCGMLLLGTGLLLFGIATVLARVLPIACGGLVLLSLGVAYPLGGLWSNWGGTVLFGLVWITIGCVLIFDKSQISMNVDTRK